MQTVQSEVERMVENMERKEICKRCFFAKAGCIEKFSIETDTCRHFLASATRDDAEHDCSKCVERDTCELKEVVDTCFDYEPREEKPAAKKEKTTFYVSKRGKIDAETEVDAIEDFLIVAVRHPNDKSNKNYLFRADADANLYMGDEVLCETKHGKEKGKVVALLLRSNLTNEAFDFLCKTCDVAVDWFSDDEDEWYLSSVIGKFAYVDFAKKEEIF